MRKLIDLSQVIHDDMPVYPGDDKVMLYQDKFLDKDKYVMHIIKSGMHSGTHIDAPMHLIYDETYISDIPLDRFAGRGVILDVRNESIIRLKDEYEEIVCANDIVILFTDHSKTYGTEAYYLEHPVVGNDLADFFVEKKIKMLGMDLPSPDNYPFEVHKKLFENHILIIENLTNLSQLLNTKNFDIMAFPLKIKAEASLARVVAYLEE